MDDRESLIAGIAAVEHRHCDNFARAEFGAFGRMAATAAVVQLWRGSLMKRSDRAFMKAFFGMFSSWCPDCGEQHRHRHNSHGTIVRCRSCGTEYRLPEAGVMGWVLILLCLVVAVIGIACVLLSVK